MTIALKITMSEKDWTGNNSPGVDVILKTYGRLGVETLVGTISPQYPILDVAITRDCDIVLRPNHYTAQKLEDHYRGKS